MRYPNEQRRSTQDLFNVRIRLADGVEAPLSSVARVTESRSFSSIDRVDGLRVVTVSAAVDTDVATPTEVNADLVARVLPELRAQFPGLASHAGGVRARAGTGLGLARQPDAGDAAGDLRADGIAASQLRAAAHHPGRGALRRRRRGDRPLGARLRHLVRLGARHGGALRRGGERLHRADRPLQPDRPRGQTAAPPKLW